MKANLIISQETISIVCQYCKREYIILAVIRNEDEEQDGTWLMAHGYCFNCGKPVDKYSERLDKIRKEGVE